MQILIFGAGAIGSVLGGLLAKSGHDITLLGRAWHLDVVRRKGLSIDGLWGEHHVNNITSVMRTDEVPQGKMFDWIFVCVKAHHTASIVETLPQLMGPKTLVCAFQNGLGNYETLTRYISSDRVALARVIFGAEIEPGSVRVSVCADEVLIGAPDEHFPKDHAVQLASYLQKSGVPSRATATILVALWAKVLYNCALNGLSTLLEVPYGKLPENQIASRLMRGVIEEAYQVAVAHRISLEPSAAAAYIEMLFTRLIPETAAHRPSMLQDLRRGRPTEIEALNGAIVQLARKVGLIAPANTLITRLVRTKERFAGLRD